ncbi:hypothetical protein D3C76_1635040 [compost metagenome]
MLTQTPTQTGIAQLEPTEDERVADFGIAAMLIAGVLGELVVILRHMVGERAAGKARVVVVAVIDGVVQAQRTDARAIAPVADRIQFAV